MHVPSATSSAGVWSFRRRVELTTRWLLGGAALCASACGGTAVAPVSPVATPPDTPPRVVVEESRETWYEEPSPTSDLAMGVREYVLDVTHTVEFKAPAPANVKPPPNQSMRVRLRFPVPKVDPVDARDVHAANRTLWQARQEMAKCHYKAAGKTPGVEMTMVAFAKIKPTGEVEDAGIETVDPAARPSAECIVENVRGLVFDRASAPAKVRFKIRLQTTDGSVAPDFVSPDGKPKK